MKAQLLLLALIGAIFCYLWGRVDGRLAAEGRAAQSLAASQQAAIRAADLASRKELERLQAVAARDEMNWMLEEAAKADADNTCSLSAGRVDRLRKR